MAAAVEPRQRQPAGHHHREPLVGDYLHPVADVEHQVRVTAPGTRLGTLGDLRRQVLQVGAAALPRGAGQRRADRGDQTAVGIGDDQLHPGQAAGAQAAQERQPAGAVLLRAHVAAEDFAVPLGVDADRDQAGDVDGAAVFADFHRQRVQRHERVMALSRGRPAERFHLRVQVLGHLRDLRLRQPGHTELLDTQEKLRGHAEGV